MKARITNPVRRPGDWVFLMLLFPCGYAEADQAGAPWWVNLIAVLVVGWMLNFVTALVHERRGQRIHVNPTRNPITDEAMRWVP